METFLSAFSFTFGVVAALALLPFLLVFVTTVIPNLVMGLITRFSSKEYKTGRWTRAVERGDAVQMNFLRKWGWDKVA
jgi:hypothetical protein